MADSPLDILARCRVVAGAVAGPLADSYETVLAQPESLVSRRRDMAVVVRVVEAASLKVKPLLAVSRPRGSCAQERLPFPQPSDSWATLLSSIGFHVLVGSSMSPFSLPKDIPTYFQIADRRTRR